MSATDTYADTFVPHPDAVEPPVHYACGICHPVPHFGMRAICGAELLGIECDGPVCQTCTTEAMRHALNHAVNMRD